MDQPLYNFLSFPGTIHLITSDQELLVVSKKLSESNGFGFDTETRPAFKKGESYPVALLQLATETEAYVIRLRQITQFEIIKKIFENPEVVKVGVAIRDDLKQLQKLFQFNPSKFLELQDLAKTKGLKNFGLKGMTQEILEATISKGPKTTNWDSPVLTQRQILYAATDAWIGLKLYQKMLAI